MSHSQPLTQAPGGGVIVVTYFKVWGGELVRSWLIHKIKIIQQHDHGHSTTASRSPLKNQLVTIQWIINVTLIYTEQLTSQQ